jgi:hypothetical protein
MVSRSAGSRRSTHRPAGVAQLVEQLIRNQQVVGSSPTAGSIFKRSIPETSVTDLVALLWAVCLEWRHDDQDRASGRRFWFGTVSLKDQRHCCGAVYLRLSGQRGSLRGQRIDARSVFGVCVTEQPVAGGLRRARAASENGRSVDTGWQQDRGGRESCLVSFLPAMSTVQYGATEMPGGDSPSCLGSGRSNNSVGVTPAERRARTVARGHSPCAWPTPASKSYRFC